MGQFAVARKTVVNDEQLSVVGAATWEENVRSLLRKRPSQKRP
jgi:hypothetical protein